MRTVWLNLLLAAAYSTTGWLGLQLPYYGEHVTLVWAPAAIALTGIVLGGTALVPGILFGSIGVNLATAPHAWPQVLAITAGNTIGPVLAGLFLTRALEFRPQLDRVRDALAYAGIGVLGTSLVTATCGALSLYAFGDAPLADLPTAWAAWIAGDAAGLLIVGPALLTWCSIPDPALAKHIAGTEKAAMGIAFAVFAAISVAYGEKIPSLPSAFGPIFVWVVLRLGPRGVSVASVCVVICLVVATALGVGPFIADSARAGMLELWVFVAAVGCASILASALICERDLALYNQSRLMGELDHRVKNTLATVMALAERSGDSAADVKDYLSRFSGRLRAVARTHEGLARAAWQPMGLAEVVAMTLSPFDGFGATHMTAEGDAVTIASSKVAPITMVLHELATNAAKYGAWSRRDGRVDITWARAAGRLRVTWRESGGPKITSTPASGYGLRLVNGLISHELGGVVKFDFAESGLLCHAIIAIDDPGTADPESASRPT